jgi:hypothetical protein
VSSSPARPLVTAGRNVLVELSWSKFESPGRIVLVEVPWSSCLGRVPLVEFLLTTNRVPLVPFSLVESPPVTAGRVFWTFPQWSSLVELPGSNSPGRILLVKFPGRVPTGHSWSSFPVVARRVSPGRVPWSFFWSSPLFKLPRLNSPGRVPLVEILRSSCPRRGPLVELPSSSCLGRVVESPRSQPGRLPLVEWLQLVEFLHVDFPGRVSWSSCPWSKSPCRVALIEFLSLSLFVTADRVPRSSSSSSCFILRG